MTDWSESPSEDARLRHQAARARVMGEELAETDADTEATNRALADLRIGTAEEAAQAAHDTEAERDADDFADTPAAGHPAGWVELIDGGELSVRIGDLIVFDPTGRDLGYEYVVGVVIDFDLEALSPGERPAPLVRINATDPGELCVVRRAKAVLA